MFVYVSVEMQFVGWGEPLDFGQQRVLNKMHTHPNLQKTDVLDFWVDMGLRGIKTTFDRYCAHPCSDTQSRASLRLCASDI